MDLGTVAALALGIIAICFSINRVRYINQIYCLLDQIDNQLFALKKKTSAIKFFILALRSLLDGDESDYKINKTLMQKFEEKGGQNGVKSKSKDLSSY